MPDVTIYHNPRCSKSRQTLALLQEKGVEPTVIEYLKDPPDQNTLARIVSMLDIEPIELIRKGEDEYKELGLADTKDDKKALIKAMTDNPILIERPIVVVEGKARIGRPPENVMEIL